MSEQPDKYYLITLENVTTTVNAARWYLAKGFTDQADALLLSLSNCIENGRLH